MEFVYDPGLGQGFNVLGWKNPDSSYQRGLNMVKKSVSLDGVWRVFQILI